MIDFESRNTNVESMFLLVNDNKIYIDKPNSVKRTIYREPADIFSMSEFPEYTYNVFKENMEYIVGSVLLVHTTSGEDVEFPIISAMDVSGSETEDKRGLMIETKENQLNDHKAAVVRLYPLSKESE